MFNKLNYYICILIVVIMMAVLTGCGQRQNENSSSAKTVELTISAAASMTDALTEIQTAYEDKHPNMKLNFNFGASGALQQQIEQGAPADLFLSAAVKSMATLNEAGLIDTSQQVQLLENEIVVVVPAKDAVAIENESDLTKNEVKIIAIGIPESVPAGAYAQEALMNLNLWESLQDKTVQAKDVRQVLQYVETGNADAGFVYKTDALISENVKVAFTVDSTTYKKVQYLLGIVKATKHQREAEEFYNYLQSQESIDIFVKYGFSVSN